MQSAAGQRGESLTEEVAFYAHARFRVMSLSQFPTMGKRQSS